MFKENELNNQETGLQEGNIEQEPMDESLLSEKIDDAIKQQNESLTKRESGHGKKTVSGLKKWAGALTLFGASFLSAGCGAKETVSESAPQKNGIENVKKDEKEATKGGQQTEQKSGKKAEENKDEFKLAKDLLNETLDRISGERRWKTKNGNLGVHIGGADYYELTESNRGELMDISKRYTNIIEKRTKNKDFRVVMQLKNAVESLVRGKIREVGARISIEDLPNNIMEFENQRKKVINEIEE